MTTDDRTTTEGNTARHAGRSPLRGRHTLMARPLKETQIIELQSDYPYCALPPHFFERSLSLKERNQSVTASLIVESFSPVPHHTLSQR